MYMKKKKLLNMTQGASVDKPAPMPKMCRN